MVQTQAESDDRDTGYQLDKLTPEEDRSRGYQQHSGQDITAAGEQALRPSTSGRTFLAHPICRHSWWVTGIGVEVHMSDHSWRRERTGACDLA